MRGQSGYNTRPDARLPPSFLDMDVWMTSQRNVSLIRKLRGSLMYLAYVSNIFSMGVCTSGHWKTFGRLVQELDVWTVDGTN